MKGKTMTYLVPLLALLAVAGCDMMTTGTPKDTPAQIINDDPGSANDEPESAPAT